MSNKKPEVVSAISDLRSKTFCSACGLQPIEWHGEHHKAHPVRRISNMVGRGYSLSAVLNEISLCEPLCRSCHMAKDGRTTELLASTPMYKGATSPSKPCFECDRLEKYLRRGLCSRCYDRIYRFDRHQCCLCHKMFQGDHKDVINGKTRFVCIGCHFKLL